MELDRSALTRSDQHHGLEFSVTTDHVLKHLEERIPILLDEVEHRSVLQVSRARIGVPADFDVMASETSGLPAETEGNLYRLVQEALHNVVKHAHASPVSVFLERKDDETILVIEDDGCGFEPSSFLESGGHSGRLGLVGMRERAESVGGSLEIESALGCGTSLYVRIPGAQREAR